MGCVTAIYKNYTDIIFLTMNILWRDSDFQKKLQLFYHSILCHLNYTQYLGLSDLAMHRLFNDDFQLLCRIYGEL